MTQIVLPERALAELLLNKLTSLFQDVSGAKRDLVSEVHLVQASEDTAVHQYINDRKQLTGESHDEAAHHFAQRYLGL